MTLEIQVWLGQANKMYIHIYLTIIHFSEVTLLFGQWIIFKNLVYSFVLANMNFTCLPF
jgi:hypothetical protein